MKNTRLSGWPHPVCILFLSSFLLVTIFSCCSWIYPTNPWDDANVFMTIGKSMKHGMKLYLDIFDHKGPCLFLIHQLAYYASENSFLGIYLLEILCIWGFQVFSYRIMRLFTDNTITLPLTVLIGVLFIASDFFWFGDSAEELSLPILSYSLFLILKFLKTSRPPHLWQSIIMGVGIGLIFWTKFTLLAFYAGALIGLVIIAYRRKQLAILNKVVLQALSGVLMVTFLVFAYFAYHGTLAELFDVYFYTNLFVYSGSISNGEPTAMLFKILKIVLCIVLVLPVALLRVRWDIKLTVALAYALQLISYTFFSVHIYYFIPLFVYAPLVIYFFRNHTATRVTYSVFALIATISAITNFNIVTLLTDRFPSIVTECAEIINEDTSTDKKVLTFSSKDTGIYIITDQLPPNPHYFVTNLQIPETKIEQANTLAKGDIKYLIRKEYTNKTIFQYYNASIPQDYELVFQKSELRRYHFLINPKMHLWNLGYTQGWLKHIMTPGQEYQSMFLYRKNAVQ